MTSRFGFIHFHSSHPARGAGMRGVKMDKAELRIGFTVPKLNDIFCYDEIQNDVSQGFDRGKFMTSSNDATLPAILGGKPLRPEGPPVWPPAWEEVAQALKQCFDTGAWGRYHGPNCRLLTERLAAYHEVEFVELCCSGTFALELALRGLHIGAGDEVILADYDFPGNFNDILAVGARPVLIDLDPDNWNLNPDMIVDVISPATRAVLVSHLHGGMVPMKRVIDVARAHKLAVIEDACQTPGAIIEGRRAGAWGDVGVISFGGSKLLSAGRGGALLTSSPEIKQRVHLYCNRGNHAFPLSELQATVLLPQLERLDHRNLARAANVSRLAENLKHVDGLRLLKNQAPSTSPAYYKVGFQYSPQYFDGLSREQFAQAAQAEGLDFNAGFRSYHLCRSSRRFRAAGDLTVASAADAKMLILHHPILLENHASVDQIHLFVKKLSRWADSIKSHLSAQNF
jgi:perosamine synthetase